MARTPRPTRSRSRPPRTALSEGTAETRPRPIRTCVGCRSTRPQDQLLRLHLDGEGRLRLDRAGPGRGAWICALTPGDCLDAATSARAIDRALRRQVDRASVADVLAEVRARPGSEDTSAAPDGPGSP